MTPHPLWAKTRRFLFGGRGGEGAWPGLSARGRDGDPHLRNPLNYTLLTNRGERANLTLEARALTRARRPTLASALAPQREVPLALTVGLDSYHKPTDRLTPDLTRAKPRVHGLGLGEGDQNKLP